MARVPAAPDDDDAQFVRRVREPRAQSAEPGRHRARRSAMMVLYRDDLVGGDVDDALATFAAEHGFPLADYAAHLVRAVTARQTELDAGIGERLDGWTVDRLGAVERAVLRIAMLELLEREVPGPIVIDEAVELAKRYATPDAAKLVNGVLGSWLRDHQSDVDKAGRP